MSVFYKQRVLSWMLIPPLVAVGCAKAPPPVTQVEPPKQPAEARLTISATADANPDASGRPSPVVVRVYQLKGDAAFTDAQFFGLFDEEEQVLGAELISRTEIVLAPSEQRTMDVPVAEEALFVGAVAAFRDIRNAQWRVLVPAWREGARHVTLAVERSRIVAAVAEPTVDFQPRP